VTGLRVFARWAQVVAVVAAWLLLVPLFDALGSLLRRLVGGRPRLRPERRPQRRPVPGAVPGPGRSGGEAPGRHAA
jgi:hypothetical protein